MIIKGLLDEDFVNYCKPSMVLFFHIALSSAKRIADSGCAKTVHSLTLLILQLMIIKYAPDIYRTQLQKL